MYVAGIPTGMRVTVRVLTEGRAAAFGVVRDEPRLRVGACYTPEKMSAAPHAVLGAEAFWIVPHSALRKYMGLRVEEAVLGRGGVMLLEGLTPGLALTIL
eukprot:891423-Prymnesium_polylepis.1